MKPINLSSIVTSRVFGKESLITTAILPLATLHMDNVIRMAEIEQRQDLVLGQLVYAMKAILLRSTRNEKRCFSIEVPITWWDHLKDDMAGSGSWFWRWVVSKLAPVEYRTESKEFEVSIRLCPHNDSYLSEDPVVHFNFLEPKSGIE